MLRAALQSRAAPRQAVAMASRQQWAQARSLTSATKYFVEKPERAAQDSIWERLDFYKPDKDMMYTVTKEVPVFSRYLRFVCEQEARPQDHAEFMQRVGKEGLQVESDAFISKSELVTLMQKNGYTLQEVNAIRATFPDVYQFHYPELAALFDLAEEDTYKFCMSTRTKAGHIGELQWSKTKHNGQIRNHWMIYFGGIYLLTAFPFFNYGFATKTCGAALWVWTNYLLMGRSIGGTLERIHRGFTEELEKKVMDGQDKLVAAMAKFAGDSACLGNMKAMKGESQEKMIAFRRAYVEEQKQLTTDKLKKHFAAIRVFENNMSAGLQEAIVRETGTAFRDHFQKDPNAQTGALDAAIIGLTGKDVQDPVITHFNKAMADLKTMDLASAKANATGTVPERVAFVYQQKEREFQETFMISTAEVAQIKEWAAKAKSADGYDFSKLDAETSEKVEDAFGSFNRKCGYHQPLENDVHNLDVIGEDAAANDFVKHVNEQLDIAKARLRNQRLTAFVTAF